MSNMDDIKVNCNIKEIPFKTSLSFKKLIQEIEKVSLDESHPMQCMAKDVVAKLEGAPILRKTIDDNSVLQEYRPLINQLMSFVANPLNGQDELSATFPPFEMVPFHSTQMFNATIAGEDRLFEMAQEIDEDNQLVLFIYHAYLIILEKIYGIKIRIDLPNALKLTDMIDKSVKYFNPIINTRYLDVKPTGPYKKLSDNELKELYEKDTDLDYWNEKIPLNNFEFTGFVQFTYINVTYDYLVSQLKSDLLDKNTVITDNGFNKVRDKIKALIENPDIEIGLAAFNDFESSINRILFWKTIIPQSRLDCHDYMGSMYETAFLEKRIVITDDLTKVEKSKVVKAFLEKGVKGHAVVPLVLDGGIVGMLEFGTAKPGAISTLQIKRLYELFPIFAIALNRSKNEWNDKIRAIIQEQFTAIHPTVEWRFREAVTSMLTSNSGKEASGIEPIVFSNVVPIYGASDVRSSSIERNFAIQSDLAEQLEAARTILENENHRREMPLLSELSYQIKEHLQTVRAGLKAGDEVSILDFLKKEINPVFQLLKDRYEEIEGPVNAYFQMLDPDLGVLYKKRKDFEDSLTLINDTVAAIIDGEQEKAQEFFPHYFEKYRTDGVEYNVYLGQSLVKDLKYNEVYLKNLQLWQLLMKVKIARQIRKLQPSLKTKLDITQLVLVHTNPLSIAFRQDEKKFDVDGAYNIRYEITKKRIDKAMIKGTNERVTQVGKIAIIYSYAEEIKGFHRYIEYMISQGYLTDSIEDFELEDLKGASGLRALRVEVNFSDLEFHSIDPVEIKEVVGAKGHL